jgi:hypothetical protein
MLEPVHSVPSILRHVFESPQHRHYDRKRVGLMGGGFARDARSIFFNFSFYYKQTNTENKKQSAAIAGQSSRILADVHVQVPRNSHC